MENTDRYFKNMGIDPSKITKGELNEAPKVKKLIDDTETINEFSIGAALNAVKSGVGNMAGVVKNSYKKGMTTYKDKVIIQKVEDLIGDIENDIDKINNPLNKISNKYNNLMSFIDNEVGSLSPDGKAEYESNGFINQKMTTLGKFNKLNSMFNNLDSVGDDFEAPIDTTGDESFDDESFDDVSEPIIDPVVEPDVTTSTNDPATPEVSEPATPSKPAAAKRRSKEQIEKDNIAKAEAQLKAAQEKLDKLNPPSTTTAKPKKGKVNENRFTIAEMFGGMMGSGPMSEVDTNSGFEQPQESESYFDKPASDITIDLNGDETGFLVMSGNGTNEVPVGDVDDYIMDKCGEIIYGRFLEYGIDDEEVQDCLVKLLQ